jgi:hypothetical protein
MYYIVKHKKLRKSKILAKKTVLSSKLVAVILKARDKN